MTAHASTGTLQGIRDLHILFGDGRTTDLRSVHCPEQARAVPLERCLACAEHGGIAREEPRRAEYVSCRHVEARGPRRAGPRDAGRTPVSAVMSTDVLAVRPDVSLTVLADLLLERGIGGAPVVDKEGRPVGMVSKTDLLGQRLLAGDTEEALGPGIRVSRGRRPVELGPGVHAEALPRASVADAMTRGSYSIPEDAPVAHAAALLALHGVHRVPVVSEDGRVAGLVTSSDIVRWLARESGHLAARGAAATRARRVR